VPPAAIVGLRPMTDRAERQSEALKAVLGLRGGGAQAAV
jgi:hypothetical protein